MIDKPDKASDHSVAEGGVNMSENEEPQLGVNRIVMRVFAVFTEHNRYGQELRGVFTTRVEAEKLKQHFDMSQDGWKNYAGGTISEVPVAETLEQWGQV